MYLNIVNNLSFENKRKKSIPLKKEIEKPSEEVIESQEVYNSYEEIYNSIFYGQLTQNWLKVTN